MGLSDEGPALSGVLKLAMVFCHCTLMRLAEDSLNRRLASMLLIRLVVVKVELWYQPLLSFNHIINDHDCDAESIALGTELHWLVADPQRTWC